ncbi:hypothetical protein CAAN1_08S05182 [[Candida] anglica]|uniref:Borealin N-terminal domain-containing protein n=1 Tax=[Candida] anglica TaxID=148631 RepID=A0ABP0E6X7_9ASCO
MKLYTKEEKEKLIEYFKKDSENRIRRLEEQYATIAQESETRILRRLNNVSATLWNVKLKDVLAIERHHKPTIKHLLADIRALHQESSFISYNDSSSADHTRNSVRPLRSVSLRDPHSRVSKPPSKRTTSSHQ